LTALKNHLIMPASKIIAQYICIMFVFIFLYFDSFYGRVSVEIGCNVSIAEIIRALEMTV